MEKDYSAPILFPYKPQEFWERMQLLIKEEISVLKKENECSHLMETPGLTYKPLYKIKEVCEIFNVSRTTIYEWIKLGRLRPFKVRSRLYFLSDDINALMSGN